MLAIYHYSVTIQHFLAVQFNISRIGKESQKLSKIRDYICQDAKKHKGPDGWFMVAVQMIHVDCNFCPSILDFHSNFVLSVFLVCL